MQLFISVFSKKKSRPHGIVFSRIVFCLELVVRRQRFRKVLFLSVNTKTVEHRFQKLHSRAFSKSCVFGYRCHRIRVDDSRMRNEKVVFSNENGYVWSGSNHYGNVVLYSHFPTYYKNYNFLKSDWLIQYSIFLSFAAK